MNKTVQYTYVTYNTFTFNSYEEVELTLVFSLHEEIGRGNRITVVDTIVDTVENFKQVAEEQTTLEEVLKVCAPWIFLDVSKNLLLQEEPTYVSRLSVLDSTGIELAQYSLNQFIAPRMRLAFKQG